MTLSAIERDLAIVACAVSAGIHAALTREHFAEGAGAGVGFLTATILAAGLAVLLTRQPGSTAALVAAVLLFAALIGSYALAITTGIPVVHPEGEPVDGLALATKAFEALGAVAALRLLWLGRNVTAPSSPQLKGTPA